MGGNKVKIKNILSVALAWGIIASVSPTHQLLAQEASESDVSTEASENLEKDVETTEEKESTEESSSEEVTKELTEEEASMLALYLNPGSDFDESKNLAHDKINESYDSLIEMGETTSELTRDDVVELFGEPGYESAYGDSEFLHYLAIDDSSAIQVKVQFYEGEGLYQVIKETRDIEVFDALEMTPEEALDYHENNGVTYEELVERLGKPTQVGYFFNSGSYEAIWVTRAEDAGEVQYVAVDFEVPTEEVLSFYSDSSYDELNPSDDESTEESTDGSEQSDESEEASSEE